MTTNAPHVFYISKAEKNGQDIDQRTIGELLGTNIKDVMVNNINYEDYYQIPGAVSFPLKTIYPGLLIGAGYTHTYKSVKKSQDKKQAEPGDFQLGFFFDHTTGMPVIPGSSVKGVLKAVFPKPQEQKEIRAEKEKYLLDIGKNNLTKEILSSWEVIFFERGQVFFDAYISAFPVDKKIFAEDYLCPHGDNIFKNPIPIRFLKIAPGVTFTFQFMLKDWNDNFKAQHIAGIFKQILLDFGIGAKRNVGYGTFIE